jgi:SsrA-binding protein
VPAAPYRQWLACDKLAEEGNFEARMAKEKAKPKDAAGETRKMIAENRKARHKFEILNTLECGIVLVGSEVKSLRAGKLSLEEAYGRVRDGEVWLVGCDIAEYAQAAHFNHEPKRPRKLLVHRRELRKFAGQAHEKGLTLVPLAMYFNQRGKAKVLLALCRGRKLHDKREVMKKAEIKRDLDRAVKGRNR